MDDEIDWWSIFRYEPETGKLFWKSPPKNKPQLLGTEAGCTNTHGYRDIGYKGRRYYRHRLVWEMHHGAIPEGYDVDHIKPLFYTNGVADDRIENLQLLTKADNARKAADDGCLANKTSKSNTGHKGIYLHARSGRYVAYGKVGYYYKKDLGEYDTLEEAIAAQKSFEDGTFVRKYRVRPLGKDKSRGVRFEADRGKWKVTFKGKTLGRFDTKEAAEKCYEKASQQTENLVA